MAAFIIKGFADEQDTLNIVIETSTRKLIVVKVCCHC